MCTNEEHRELVCKMLQGFTKPVSLHLTTSQLDLHHIARIGSFRPSDQHQVKLKPSSRLKVDANYKFLKDTLDSGKLIYGVNTGYGGSGNIETEDAFQTQKTLIQFLNCGVMSQTLPPGIVKAIMLVRANSLSMARSGVRGEVIELLCAMINHDIVPVVPLRGTVSSSGDLMCLSYIAAAMNGDKKDALVYYKGVKNVTTQEAFNRAGLSFIQFHPKEALGVLNSASCSSTLGSDNLFHFGHLTLLTQLITAMSVEALYGRMESFDTLVYESLSHVGMKEVCENVKRLLAGSALVRIHDDSTHLQPDQLVQDRYGLRTAPQWLSSVVETFKESVRRLRVELNSTCDNPLVDHEAKKIVHGGNFQGVNVTVAMDQTRQGVQMCGRLIFAQLSEVLNDKMNHLLSPNLSGTDHCKDFGFKGVDTALAAYTSELDSLANPMTNHVLSAEMHNQSINSMALVSARRTRESLEILKLIVASSLVALCQALDLRWLRSRILNDLDHVSKQLALNCDLIKADLEKHWYNVAFKFDATKAQLDALLTTTCSKEQLQDRACFHATFEQKCEEDVKKAYENKHEADVAALLGKGTQKIYTFVRKDLGVKFYQGASTLDADIQKVHDALAGDEMLQVLQDVFRL